MKATMSLSFAALSGCLFLSSQADAATLFLQPGSGHEFLSSGAVLLTDTFAADSFLFIIDGRRILVDHNSTFGASPVSRTWVVPIPIDVTSVNWSTVTRDSFSAGSYSQRVCAFTNIGLFSSCGASVGHTSTSTAFVPSGGTAFSQHFMTARNDATANPQGRPAVSTVEASRP